MDLRMSDDGIELLKGFEAFRSKPYQDEAGHWTIGYGHKIEAGEDESPVTEEEALDLLRTDIAWAERAVCSLIPAMLVQHQFDALVSLVFNIGTSAFQGSTLLQKLNAGDFAGAATEFLRWNKVTIDGVKQVSEGLSNRRAKEQGLFLGDDSNDKPAEEPNCTHPRLEIRCPDCGQTWDYNQP
jgi:lysozyme